MRHRPEENRIGHGSEMTSIVDEESVGVEFTISGIIWACFPYYRKDLLVLTTEKEKDKDKKDSE